MKQQYVEKYARLLARYSLNVKPGQIVKIRGTESCKELVAALYKEVLVLGGNPLYDIVLENLGHPFVRDVTAEDFYRLANEKQLEFIPNFMRQEMEEVDALIRILGYAYTESPIPIDPKKTAIRDIARRNVMRPFYARADQGKATWCVAGWPTKAYAKDSGMTLREFERFFVRACFLHKDDPVAEWQKFGDEMQKIANLLASHKNFHIFGPGVDLEISAAGRIWEKCDGKMNMPDGEVFTGPIEDSANGWIEFNFPAIYRGQELDGVKLEFRDGLVIRYEADEGLPALEGLLNTDAGAKRLGELAFGLNPFIQRGTKKILFDEKIGGTMHLAIGESYPTTGGKNESAVHQDMVCDLRTGSEIQADGEVIYRDGKFLV